MNKITARCGADWVLARSHSTSSLYSLSPLQEQRCGTNGLLSGLGGEGKERIGIGSLPNSHYSGPGPQLARAGKHLNLARSKEMHKSIGAIGRLMGSGLRNIRYTRVELAGPPEIIEEPTPHYQRGSQAKLANGSLSLSHYPRLESCLELLIRLPRECMREASAHCSLLPLNFRVIVADELIPLYRHARGIMPPSRNIFKRAAPWRVLNQCHSGAVQSAPWVNRRRRRRSEQVGVEGAY